MVAKTIPALLSDMPAVPGGISAGDIINLVHTTEARSRISVKQYGAVGTEIDASDGPGRIARAAIDTQAFLDATAAASGTSTLYIPAGYYYINSNTWVIPTRLKIEGDGTSSRITRRNSGWLMDISGFGDFVAGTQTRNNAVTLRDLQLHGSSNSGTLIRAYYSSEILIDKCKFAFNDGPAIDGVEWWDSRVQNCFFDWCGGSDTERPVIYLRNAVSVTDTGVFGYSADSTNAIVITGCRFESFSGHAIKFNSTEVMGADSLSQIFVTNCKFETHYLGGSILKFSNNNVQANIHFDNIFMSVNAFNEGYTTATDLIDWFVNNGCSLRNIWVFIADPSGGVTPLVRTVVRSNCSFVSNTIENIFVSGTKPSYGVLEAQGSTDPILLGFIGGVNNSIGATSVTEHAGGFRVLTAARTAIQSDNGQTYTNATAGNFDVTIPANVWPGWTLSALQLSAAGTITFVAATGVTFQLENGTNHRRTAGLNNMMKLIVTSNTDAATAAVCHVSGKTVAAP
jgi:hypothetical protein